MNVPILKIYSSKEKLYGILSNNYKYSMEIDNEVWNTVTNYIYANLVKTPSHINILKNENVIDVEKTYDNLKTKEINTTTINAIEKAQNIKFENKDLEKLLMETGDSNIEYVSPNEVYGFNPEKIEEGKIQGQNIIGKTLMDIRKKIKNRISPKIDKNTDNIYLIYKTIQSLSNAMYKNIDIDKYKNKTYENIINDVYKNDVNIRNLLLEKLKNLENDYEEQKSLLYNELGDIDFNMSYEDVVKFVGKNKENEEILKKIENIENDYIKNKSLLYKQLRLDIKYFNKPYFDVVKIVNETSIERFPDKKIVIDLFNKGELKFIDIINNELKNPGTMIENIKEFYKVPLVKKDPIKLEKTKDKEIKKMMLNEFMKYSIRKLNEDKLCKAAVLSKITEEKCLEMDIEDIKALFTEEELKELNLLDKKDYKMAIYESLNSIPREEREKLNLEERIKELYKLGISASLSEKIDKKLEKIENKYKDEEMEIIEDKIEEDKEPNSFDINLELDKIQKLNQMKIDTKKNKEKLIKPTIILYENGENGNFSALTPNYFFPFKIGNYTFPTITHYVIFKLFEIFIDNKEEITEKAQKRKRDDIYNNYILNNNQYEVVHETKESLKTYQDYIHELKEKGEFRTLSDLNKLYTYLLEKNIYEKMVFYTERGLNEKFSNFGMQDILFSTGNSNIVYLDSNTVLGINPDTNEGINVVGKYLMFLRNKLIKERGKDIKIMESKKIPDFFTKDRDRFFMLWLEMRLKDICKTIHIVQNYMYDKYRKELIFTENHIIDIIEVFYKECFPVLEIDPLFKIEDVPQEFVALLKATCLRRFIKPRKKTLKEKMTEDDIEYVYENKEGKNNENIEDKIVEDKKDVEDKIVEDINAFFVPLYGIKEDPIKDIDWNKVILEPYDYDRWAYLSSFVDWDMVKENNIYEYSFLRGNEEIYPFKWNWVYLSQNPKISWDSIKENDYLPWVWKFVGLNRNITEEIIRDNFHYDWDLCFIFKYNANIDKVKLLNIIQQKIKDNQVDKKKLEQIEELCPDYFKDIPDLQIKPSSKDYDLNDRQILLYDPNYIKELDDEKIRKIEYYKKRDEVSGRSDITLDIIKEEIELPWNWDIISERQNMTFDMIKENKTLPWNWDIISERPDITWETIYNNIEHKNMIQEYLFPKDKINWNWDIISGRPDISLDIIKNHMKDKRGYDIPWNWDIISDRPDITLEMIENNKELPWKKIIVYLRKRKNKTSKQHSFSFNGGDNINLMNQDITNILEDDEDININQASQEIPIKIQMKIPKENSNLIEIGKMVNINDNRNELVKALWRYFFLIIYYLIKLSSTPNILCIKKMIMMSEILSIQKKQCKMLINDDINCILNAIINILMMLKKYSKKNNIKNFFISEGDIFTAVYILLGKNIPLPEYNEKIDKIDINMDLFPILKAIKDIDENVDDSYVNFLIRVSNYVFIYKDIGENIKTSRINYYSSE